MTTTVEHVTSAAPPAHPRKTVEEWARQKKTEGWLFQATRIGERWPIGAELTEQDFDDAIRRAGSVTLR